MSHIIKVELERFKQYKQSRFELAEGVTLAAGGNNSGKSTILQSLAVWEFCKLATQMQRGSSALLQSGVGGQGFGLDAEQFSPIDLPSLRHLWWNLQTQVSSGSSDGAYNLKVTSSWRTDSGEHSLGFGLALVNNRLFIKTSSSTLEPGDISSVPTAAYLPPFAGITSHEARMTQPVRRRRIGEGLSGAILRNLLLDMKLANDEVRAKLRDPETNRIKNSDLQKLRSTDPWELMQQTLRSVFGLELVVRPFVEEFHQYISIEVARGEVSGNKIRRYPNSSTPDIMVEGRGFLQWLSVFALVTSPEVDVVLLDEPDAHLHPTLQEEMLARIEQLAASQGKQVLVATHSAEIIGAAAPSRILRSERGKKPKYLIEESQKASLLAGIGSHFAPRIDRLKKSRTLVFVEGSSDERVLRHLASALGTPVREDCVFWRTTQSHSERRALYGHLAEEISDIRCLSLRDRDEAPPSNIGDDLSPKGENPIEKVAGGSFRRVTWRRRHIEGYLAWPSAIAVSLGVPRQEIEKFFLDEFSLVLTEDKFTAALAPPTLLDLRAKEDIFLRLGVKAGDVAQTLSANLVPDDVKQLIAYVNDL